MPVGTLQVVGLTDRSDESDDDGYDKYYLQFCFVDVNEKPYSNINYTAFFSDNTQIRGITDVNGYTEVFVREDDSKISVKLFNPDFDTCWGKNE